METFGSVWRIVFSSSKQKKLGKHVWQSKVVFYFLFLRIKNMVFLGNIFKLFYVILTCFLRVDLKNNYINMQND